MARVRTPLTLRVSWGNQPHDISGAVQSFRVKHGTSRFNADRPTISPALGELTLFGGQYQPEHPQAVASVADLSQQATMVVTHGPDMVWTGFVEAPRIISRAVPVTRYRVVGRQTRIRRRRINHAHSHADFPNDAEWLGLIGTVPRLVGDQTVGLSFSPFIFEGPAFDLLSRMGMVLGRVVGENRTGGIDLPLISRGVPEGLIRQIASGTHRMLTPNTTVVSDTVRNRVVIPFATEPEVTVQGQEAPTWTDTGEATTPNPYVQDYLPTSHTVTVTPPPLIDRRTTRDNFRVEILEATARVPLATDRRNPPTWNFRQDGNYVFQDVDISGAITPNLTALANGDYTITLTLDNTATYDLGTWYGVDQSNQLRDRDRNQVRLFFVYGDRKWKAAVGSASAPGRRGAVEDMTVRFRLAWDATHTPDRTVTFNSAASQAVWGPQTLEFPLWVANTGLEPTQPNGVAIQALVNYLGQFRTYHTVRLPLWQEDPMLSTQIATTDFGDYVQFHTSSIAEVCVVTSREVIAGRRNVPSVVLELLETHQGLVDRVITVDDDPIRVDSQELTLL